MDFKIGDDIDENGAVEHKLVSDKTKIIIVVVASLIAGLSVFLITNAIFGRKEVPVEPPKVTKESLKLDDEDVIDSYRIITYGPGGVRNNKFLSGIDIEANSFSNSEKYNYALMFSVKDDFTQTDKKDDNGFVIYSLPESSMDIYMTRVFGDDFSYSKDGNVSNTFRFNIDGKDTGLVKYNSNRNEFEISLGEKYTPPTYDNVVDPFYYFIDDAYSYSDGRLVIVEKVLYTNVVDNNGVKDVYLYSDFNKSKSIATLNNVTRDSLVNKVESNTESADKYSKYPDSFKLDDYEDKMGVITYNFKLGSRGYYFVSSEVEK